ncbi:MAG: N-acetyl-gamma-glutamyl-phosphate reductase [endosymbiont of Galathealinum brachiosum]|uniref:N-acetyl-gamma-glutamyl-phosphate reductase n=1 Tax=endosymbiont of Galathealinum brachiosum TaxID=2200906 RepID=A0A370DE27_9GAMM|nr:MAG: N-acetyl-gamma-glutamyl-phosphate reductase [endosymbiont of Galathealinum brachiosum]
MIKAGIVGGTGYTGVELLRLLVAHKDVELSVITSRSEAGQAVSSLYPNLRGHVDINFSEPDIDSLAKCDVVFFATPNGTAMKMVPQLLEAGAKVIDLAADFRIKDTATWKQWYGMDHACPDILEEAVYGMPELNREAIKQARIIANPGCYPTAVSLGYIPLIENNLIDDAHLIADAKSGVSGAGRGASVATLLCEATESVKAYGVDGHRHLPEIRQVLGGVAGHDVGLTFVPHLMPMIRGIEATLYGVLKTDVDDLHQIYAERYKDEPFVDVLPLGSVPETRSVKGSNMCRISVFRPQGGDTVVVSSVIDNLVKGAAGQAVHNMNLMFGLDEKTGISQVALLP